MLNQNKRKAEYTSNQMFSPLAKKVFHFGGSAGSCGPETIINDISSQENHCKSRPFPQRYYSPPTHASNKRNGPPMGYDFGPYNGQPHNPLMSPQNKFKPNPNLRPAYESRDWNPMMGWHYRPPVPTENISNDLLEIVNQLRRTTDSIKSEIRIIGDVIEISNKKLIDAIEESNNKLRNSLVEELEQLKQTLNSNARNSSPKTE